MAGSNQLCRGFLRPQNRAYDSKGDYMAKSAMGPRQFDHQSCICVHQITTFALRARQRLIAAPDFPAISTAHDTIPFERARALTQVPVAMHFRNCRKVYLPQGITHCSLCHAN